MAVGLLVSVLPGSRVSNLPNQRLLAHDVYDQPLNGEISTHIKEAVLDTLIGAPSASPPRTHPPRLHVIITISRHIFGTTPLSPLGTLVRSRSSKPALPRYAKRIQPFSTGLALSSPLSTAVQSLTDSGASHTNRSTSLDIAYCLEGSARRGCWHLKKFPFALASFSGIGSEHPSGR